MSVTNSIVDFFQGNPFSHPIGALIEQSTDARNECENWTLFMEICDQINGSEDGPRAAIRAIKRRINMEINKCNLVVSYTLTLLEVCVKNCGYRFHLVVCTRDFLQEFEKLILINSNTLINGRVDVPVIIRDKILQLTQSWYDSFRGQPDLKEIEFFYFRLLECGVEFPAQDIDKMSPINMPKKVTSGPAPSNQGDVSNADTSQVNSKTAALIDQAKVSPQKSPMKPVQQPKKQNSNNKINFNQVVEKLSNEIQAVQQNIDVFSELMQEYPCVPNDTIPDEAITLMANLNAVCLEMQTRLVILINNWEEYDSTQQATSVLPDLLRVNDELNSVLAQYERYERSLKSSSNKDGDCNNKQNNKSNDKVDDDDELIGAVAASSLDDTLDTKRRIKKSQLTDMYAAQEEAKYFYNGFSQIPNWKNQNQIGIPKNEQGAMSSQEFDQFLNERIQPSNSSTINNNPPHIGLNSTNGDNSKPALHVPSSITSKPAPPETNKSNELFDL